MKSRDLPSAVIPAKAGIQGIEALYGLKALDPGLRRDDVCAGGVFVRECILIEKQCVPE